MKLKNLLKFLCVLCSFVSINTLVGQGAEYGIGVGSALYWGDLSPSSPGDNIKNLELAGSLFLRGAYNERFSFRGNLLIGSLSGSDANNSSESMQQRNLSFHSNIFELGAFAEFHFLNLNMFNKYHGLRMYITVGAAITRFNPTTTYQGQKYDLQPLGTEGQGIDGFAEPYGLTTFSFPVGGGMKIRITDKWTINPEIAVRTTLTDHLDDVSGANYVDYNTLRRENGEIAAALGNREGEFLGLTEPIIREGRRGGIGKDFYFVGMLYVTYRFSDDFSLSRKRSRYDTGCPTF